MCSHNTTADDEKVRVWDTEDLKCERTLHSDKWGQVTTLGWIHVDTPIDDKCTVLFVGGGRGYVSLRAVPGGANLREEFKVKTFAIFDFNNAVEAQAYDRANSRLAISSHSGSVKMFFVDKSEHDDHIMGFKSVQLIFHSGVVEATVEY